MIAAALLILAQGFPPPAPPGPEPKCRPHREMVYVLANQFMEFARWQGIDKGGAMLETCVSVSPARSSTAASHRRSAPPEFR
jgi:hypothetical protein